MTGDVILGQVLRGARRDAALSQTDVEQRCGIPKARISRYENHHVTPSIESLSRLGSALGVSASELLARAGR